MQTLQLKSAPIPWYREPWPWLIMLGPAIVVVAGISTAVIAYRNADGLVADDYYKEGLAINKVLAREQRAVTLQVRGTAWYSGSAGYSGTARYSGTSGRVRVQVDAAAVLPAVLTLRLAHPTLAGMDQTVMLRAIEPGIYEAQLTLPDSPHWLVALDGSDWRIDGEWNGHDPWRFGAPQAAPVPH